MAEHPTRRSFMATAAASAVAMGTQTVKAQSRQPAAHRAQPPIAIASANGLGATQTAGDMITQGADTLDAVIAGVNLVEADPDDHSVGYGGLPNEDGVVELDSSVMHGPTHDTGAVAALRNIMHPSRVAKLVMTRTDHAMIVGEGALRFAKAHGFKEVDLLTDEARKLWLRWKERHSDRDDWISPPGEDEAGGEEHSSSRAALMHTYGTIHCSALNDKGELSGVTTTSGLSYKIPGRVGDSPIIGAGLYVDNEIGAAGSTGRGESVIQNCGAFAVVELMRTGAAPTDACLEVLKRIVNHARDPWLINEEGLPAFDVKMYALAKDGRFGSAAIWSGANFAVYSDGKSRHEECAYLFERRQRD